MTVNFLDSPGIKNIHFIGIGGISMSGLAEILHDLKFKVSGSDLKTSDITQKLKSMNIPVYIGHSPENIKDADLVVYTAAISPDNPELIEAKRRGLPVMDRAALLGNIMKKYDFSIAISGTHGKTTTTSMISLILIECGLDPTVHIGGNLDAINGSVKLGGNKYFVTEACEYSGSFLKFFPDLAVILNVEFDHADYFRDIGHVKETFRQFASQVHKNGFLVVNGNDKNVLQVVEGLDANIITFGINSGNNTFSAADIKVDESGYTEYTLLHNGRILGSIKLRVPGIHNVYNSLAAYAACSVLGLEFSQVRDALEKFHGTGRRQETKGIINGIKVMDDYAHHPSEIIATLKAIRPMSGKRLWCVFQPHTYTRTKFLMNEFACAFDNADTVIVTDIYAAREKDTGEVHSTILVDAINRHRENKAVYIKDFSEIVRFLRSYASSGDLIITMGAGDIYKVGEMFLEDPTCKL